MSTNESVVGDSCFCSAADAADSVDVTSLEDQRRLFAEAEQVRLVKDDIYNVVDARWFRQWKKYSGLDPTDSAKKGERSVHPGPVDLSLICDEKQALKADLKEDEHYVLVPSVFWHKLVEWYGLRDGYEPIERRVVEYGDYVKECGVEVYLVNLRLIEYDNQDVAVLRSFSRINSLEHVLDVAKEVFKYDSGTECRLWIRTGDTGSFELVKNFSGTVVESSLSNGDYVLVEQRSDDGQWQYKASDNQSPNYNSGSGTSSCNSNNLSSRSWSGTYSSSRYNNPWGSSQEASLPGVCGLTNLGNTCFMNSALQCLSNTAQLTAYFLKNTYQEELNTQNPLGMKGLLATAYAELLRLMWSGKYSSVTPRDFKLNVSRFAPQFSGYAQHDSQELLAFLLDGLHEDLNRIKKKPYVELKSSDGRPDAVVATEAWENHLKRNDSVIVDMFQGQLKSTLVCPACKFVSVTFDPFMFLSLPLPVKKMREIEVTLVYLNPLVRPKAFVVTVPKVGTIRDLVSELAFLSGVRKEQIVVTDNYSHSFYKIYAGHEVVSCIFDRDVIFAYEVDVECCNQSSDVIALPVYHRRREKRAYSYYSHSSGYISVLFGWPLFVFVSKHSTYRTLYEAIIKQLSRYVCPDDAAAAAVVSTASENSSLVTESTKNGSFVESSLTIKRTETDASSQNGDVSDSCTTNEKDTLMEVICTPPDLFQITEVNSYGTTDFGELVDNGENLNLSDRMYVALDWHDQWLENCYDTEEAEKCDQDETVSNTSADKMDKQVDLAACLNLFTNEEQLGEDDPWYCPKCKKHQQATKKFDIWCLPKFLVIHLKRFSYSRYSRDKLETRVGFPLKGLELSDYCINPAQMSAGYDLYAVSNHYGGLGGGHYTAYARNVNDDCWYHFDDSSVMEVDEAELCSSSAYVLCYAQRETAQQNGDR